MTFDFNWLRPWTLLVKSTAIEALGGVLNKHQTARPSLAYPKGIRDELLELQIEPKCELHENSFTGNGVARCKTCGRNPRPLKVAVIDRHSIPAQDHLFRPANFPTLIVVTNRFMNVCKDAGLTNVAFQEIGVA